MSDEQKPCIESVYDRNWQRFSPCSRKVSPKDPDGRRCGLHLADKLRRAAKNNQYTEAQEGRVIAEARVQQLAGRFTFLMGDDNIRVSMSLHTEYAGAATGRVSTGAAIVPLALLDAMAQRIEDLQARVTD